MYENQYRVEGEVVDVALNEPKEAGQWPSLAVKFRYSEEEGMDAGRPKFITAYMYFTEKAIQFTEENLRTLGWDPIKNSWQIDELVSTQSIIGVRASLVLEAGEYNGKPQTKVKFINAIGGGKLKSVDPQSAFDFTRALQKKLGVSGKPRPMAAAAPKPAPTRQTAPIADDDNIPF